LVIPIEEKETTTEDSEEFEVERIIQERTHEGQGLQYRVRFKGCDNRSNRWVRPEDSEMPDLIAEFETRVATRGQMPWECPTDAQAEKFIMVRNQARNNAPV